MTLKRLLLHVLVTKPLIHLHRRVQRRCLRAVLHHIAVNHRASSWAASSLFLNIIIINSEAPARPHDGNEGVPYALPCSPKDSCLNYS